MIQHWLQIAKAIEHKTYMYLAGNFESIPQQNGSMIMHRAAAGGQKN